MNDEAEKEAVAAAYQAYTRAFLANVMSDSFPVKPADLIAEKQWHSTADTEFEVVGLSADKAHVIPPRARRLRADGSLIETVSAFCAFTRTDEG
jgi:hypothetical protein